MSLAKDVGAVNVMMDVEGLHPSLCTLPVMHRNVREHSRKEQHWYAYHLVLKEGAGLLKWNGLGMKNVFFFAVVFFQKFTSSSNLSSERKQNLNVLPLRLK